MFTPDSPLDTSVMTSKSKLPVVCLLPRPLLSPPLSHRHVHTGQGPIPLSKQGHRNSYKKINTGMRCHLVSRPANTPRECPRPHGALTQICGGVCVFLRGCHPPPAGCPPTCLTHSHHLLRFAGQGFTAARFSVQTLVLHLFHMAACGLPTVSSVCDSGRGRPPCPEENKEKTMSSLAVC